MELIYAFQPVLLSNKFNFCGVFFVLFWKPQVAIGSCPRNKHPFAVSRAQQNA